MSNTPGRHGTTSSVAARIASVTLADIFGAVSTKTHSMPSRFAARTISPMPRSATLSGKSSDCGSRALRSLCQSVSDPCGSASIRRHARDGLWACAAICAASVLLPEPPLREAKTTTFMRALPSWPSGKIVLVPLIPKLADARRYPMPISESLNSVTPFRYSGVEFGAWPAIMEHGTHGTSMEPRWSCDGTAMEPRWRRCADCRDNFGDNEGRTGYDDGENPAPRRDA